MFRTYVPWVCRVTLSLLIAVGLSAPLAAQVIDPGNVVIENVIIANEGGDDTPVNLLVRDNKLELVTPDDIPLQPGMVALDSGGGYLIGFLDLGKAPNFIILDADPRNNLEVLADTRGRSVYTVVNGELHKNSLEPAHGSSVAPTEHAHWRAYMPPPVALPTHYGESADWNHWTTENATIILFAVTALDRMNWISQRGESTDIVGDLGEYDGGEVRDIRLGILGTLNYFDRPLGYNLSFATNAFNEQYELGGQDNFKALDYRLDIPVGADMKLGVGKQKEPISMDRLMTLIINPMQERSSVSDAFLRPRNFGLLLSGNALDGSMSWAGGVFNNFIDEEVSISKGETAMTGRVTWLPFDSEDSSSLVHLAFAARATNGKQGYEYKTEPEFNKAPVFVDTGLGPADRTMQYSLEASWRRGPLWLVAEAMNTRVDSPAWGNLDFNGYSVTASWILTGEMRNYFRKNGTFGGVPVSRSMYQNGFGAWELASRWSSIRLNDGPVNGGEMDIFSLGVNWWLSSKFSLSMNYRYIFNEKERLDGETSGLNIRLLLKL